MLGGVGSPNGLVMKDVPVPRTGPDQVLVKVRAAGMNRADLAAAVGGYSTGGDSQDRPIGMEWAGEVVALGEGVTELRVGDLVSCSGSGGYAEFAIADKGRAIRFSPGAFSFEQAAVLPLVLMTAHNALVTVGKMKKGDAVLVHGASSAVGLAALQIARLLGAGFVAGTSTDAVKRGRLRDFGADCALDPTREGWSADFLEASDGTGANVIVDMVTGPGINETLKTAAVLATAVNVGRLDGAAAEFDLDFHALKRISFVGVTFRTRSLTDVRDIVSSMKADLWNFVEAGELSLPIDKSFPLAQAPDAHAHMASNRHFGKLVLVP